MIKDTSVLGEDVGMKYCIQCVDQNSGQTGDFGYDSKEGNQLGSFHAITPVFSNLQDFYQWVHANKVELKH